MRGENQTKSNSDKKSEEESKSKWTGIAYV
jgi:hypothetical protein